MRVSVVTIAVVVVVFSSICLILFSSFKRTQYESTEVDPSPLTLLPSSPYSHHNEPHLLRNQHDEEKDVEEEEEEEKDMSEEKPINRRRQNRNKRKSSAKRRQEARRRNNYDSEEELEQDDDDKKLPRRSRRETGKRRTRTEKMAEKKHESTESENENALPTFVPPSVMFDAELVSSNATFYSHLSRRFFNSTSSFSSVSPSPSSFSNSYSYSSACRSVCRWQYDWQLDRGYLGRAVAFEGVEGAEELVCPTMFRDLADYVVDWPFAHFSESVNLPPLHSVANCLLAGAIIYSQTGPGISKFCNEMLPKLKYPFIFISGQSDYNPSTWCPQLLSHSLLIRWYAQNADTIHPKLVPIPIGLNCFEHAPEMITFLKQQHHQHAIDSNANNKKNDESQGSSRLSESGIRPLSAPLATLLRLSEFEATSPQFDSVSHSHSEKAGVEENTAVYQGSRLSLVNFGTSSHVRRVELRKELCSSSRSSFITCAPPSASNGIMNNPHLISLYDNYSKYKLWFSPHGNGVDTHRTWEALYVGAVPILEHSTLDPIYNDGDLPVLIVDNLLNVNETWLRSQLPRFLRVHRDFPRRKLTRWYWRSLILKDRRQALHDSVQQLHHIAFDVGRERRLCWGK